MLVLALSQPNRSRKYGLLFRGTGFCTISPLIHFVVVVFVVVVFCFQRHNFEESQQYSSALRCTPKLSEQDDIIVKYTHAFPSDRDTIHHPNIQHPPICNTAGYIFNKSKEEEVAQSETEICTK